METAVKLLVEGNVQGVGYRALVNQMARRLRLKGHVQNMADGTVQIFCQGEPKSIEAFKKGIAIKSEKQGPFNLHTDKIVETPVDANNDVGFFHIDYGEEAKTPFERTNLERLEIGSLILSDVRDKVDNLREDTNKNFSTMSGKYGEISNRMETISKSLEKSNENNGVLIKALIQKLETK